MFIGAIIHNALEDAVSFRKPRMMSMVKPFWWDVLQVELDPEEQKFDQQLKLAVMQRKLREAREQLTKEQLAHYEKLSRRRELETLSYEARCFIDKRNKLFRYYCQLLDLEPEWVAQRMWDIIHEYDNNYSAKKIRFDTF